jgi:hypothetical protein
MKACKFYLKHCWNLHHASCRNAPVGSAIFACLPVSVCLSVCVRECNNTKHGLCGISSHNSRSVQMVLLKLYVSYCCLYDTTVLHCLQKNAKVIIFKYLKTEGIVKPSRPHFYTMRTLPNLCDFRLPPRCRWYMSLSGILRSVEWLILYRRFGITYQPHLQGSRSAKRKAFLLGFFDPWRWDR